MLRRPLTVIRLTTEDVLDYDDRKAKENEQQHDGSKLPSHGNNGNRESAPAGGKKSKEQRIGLTQ